MPLNTARLRDNLGQVRERIAAAAARAGRMTDAITLVAVIKRVPLEVVRAIVDAGCHQLGESRPQDLWSRSAALAGRAVEWHLIGHLQRNKVRRTVPLAAWIHSVDRLSLLEEVEKCDLAAPLKVLVEINVSGDATKHGLPASQAEPFLLAAAAFQKTRVCGLMTMAAREGDLACARRNFADLRALAERLQPRMPDAIDLSELSMGMSGDFETAIEEGATMVRIGSALFEGVS